MGIRALLADINRDFDRSRAHGRTLTSVDALQLD